MLKNILTVALLTFMAVPALAIEKGRDRGAPEDKGNEAFLETYDAMSLTLPDNSRFRALSVLIAAPNGLFAFSFEDRIAMRDEDRLPLSGLPLVGGLFMPQLLEESFDPALVIGSAHRDGDRLVLILDGANFETKGDGTLSVPTPDGGLYQPRTLSAANQKVSYHTQLAAARPAEPEGQDLYDLPQIGEVYWSEDALLILVHPSIITHWE